MQKTTTPLNKICFPSSLIFCVYAFVAFPSVQHFFDITSIYFNYETFISMANTHILVLLHTQVYFKEGCVTPWCKVMDIFIIV